MLIIFFDIKGIVYKEFVLAGQTVNSAYYCGHFMTAWKCGKTLPRNVATKGILHHNNTPPYTSFLPREFLTKNNMAVVSHPTYFSKDKTERQPFWHNWGGRGRIVGGTEHAFQDKLKKMALVLGMVDTRGRRLLWGWWWPVRPKVSFWPDGSTSPGNYGWLFVKITATPYICTRHTRTMNKVQNINNTQAILSSICSQPIINTNKSEIYMFILLVSYLYSV
jgi:hypothetical protein